ncbi:MAG: sugar ABC transporter permease [Caldilinea sp. CFX5]|nr:sugar ABC transporter permease [Caldilinea sp. CFX5]
MSASKVIVQTHRSERRLSLLFLAPAVLFLLFTSVYPLLYSLRLSFYSWNMSVPNSQPVFIGLDNYTRLFSDPNFLSSVRITLIFVAASVTLEFLLGMALALLATANLKIVGLIRTVLLIPLMMTPVVVGVLWRTLFHTSYGAINFFLNLVGIPSQPFVGDPRQALASVIAVEIWQQLPVVVFILAAGIQSLPIDLYKAARVDGASSWQIFREITLPLLRPVILVVLLLRIMDAFRVFDIIWTLTFGGPGRTTELLSMMIYKSGLQFFQIGQASAMSWLFLLVIFCISIFFIRELQQKRR